MENPYSLARDILLSALSAGRFTSIDLYGASVHEKGTEDGYCSRYHLENGSDTGDTTLYQVFPGMKLIYNDMHMAYCNKQQRPTPNVMEIN